MTRPLPQFRYHPDPVATGLFKPSAETCACCGEAPGTLYVGPAYSTHDLRGRICPWCIADGSAAARFEASFVDDYPLLDANLPMDVVDELCTRTPGYISWQQDHWLSHCGDACAFHGDASVDDVRQASVATRQQWMTYHQQDEGSWQLTTQHYRPGGDSALYKFVCRHCDQVLFGWDLS